MNTPRTDAILEHWDFDYDNCHDPLVELARQQETEIAALKAVASAFLEAHDRFTDADKESRNYADIYWNEAKRRKELETLIQ